MHCGRRDIISDRTSQSAATASHSQSAADPKPGPKNLPAIMNQEGKCGYEALQTQPEDYIDWSSWEGTKVVAEMTSHMTYHAAHLT